MKKRRMLKSDGWEQEDAEQMNDDQMDFEGGGISRRFFFFMDLGHVGFQLTVKSLRQFHDGEERTVQTEKGLSDAGGKKERTVQTEKEMNGG